MPNTSPQAARRGFEIFSAVTPPPSLDEINLQLSKREMPAVSLRTYDHYRRLARHGYSHYVPINELDVAVKAERLREAS